MRLLLPTACLLLAPALACITPTEHAAGDGGTKDGGTTSGDGSACVPCDPGLVCDPGSMHCVQCFENDQCLSGKCRKDGTCAPCDGPEDCGSGLCVDDQCVQCERDAHCLDEAAPRCDVISNTCVECLGTEDCEEGTPLCDADTLQCVQCLDADDCDSDAPVCRHGTCMQCAGDTDCAEHPGAPACVAGACVQCSDDNLIQCSDALPWCGPQSACVQCTEAVHCDESAPVCEDGACIGCTGDVDCARLDDTPTCAPSGACVECTRNADCTSADNPVCQLDHTCGKCQQDSECQGRGQVCDEGSGRCVDCEPDADDPEAENCDNGRACDPETLTCTGEYRRSLSFCGASLASNVGVLSCISDSECIEDYRCVMTDFPKGTPFRRYCLPKIEEGPCPDQVVAKRPATSVLGVFGDYCFPNDFFTTCEGILSFTDLCDTDADCGAWDDAQDQDVSDGLCVDDRCTYGCNANRDCSTSSQCIGPLDSGYCDPN